MNKALVLHATNLDLILSIGPIFNPHHHLLASVHCHELLLAMLRGPHEMLRIKLDSTKCKSNSLPVVISLWP